jgi:hypothetical protein
MPSRISHPNEGNNNKPSKNVVVVPPVEMTVTPPAESSVSTPMRSPFSSRRSSIFPAGGFRNRPEALLDIKTDIMSSWLHQQQMEKIWSSEPPGEGVVLKKARGIFTCRPSSLRGETNALFDDVMAMNVGVSLIQFAPNSC